jgi:hypothetical protein
MILVNIIAYIALVVVAMLGTLLVFVLMIYYIIFESKAKKIW